jgi:RecG-like helicase
MGFEMPLTPKRRAFLTKLNLHSEWEVLWYVPRRYIDYTSTPLDQALHDQRVVVRGTLDSKSPPYD